MTVPRKYRKLFQDAIVVNIPLDVTADLGVAIKRTRAKRIEALYRHFPSLKKETKTPTTDDKVKQLDDEEDEEEEVTKNKQKPNLHQPLREQYGSVLDYLEAKYVMGVTVPSSEGEDEEEDRGSVYSEGSFLDDTQLKSELAEQMLSQKTHTKVGVENEDDDEFFVNVGNLEVEEHELMDYDPLQEETEEKQQVKKRKRPADASKSSANNSTSSKTTAKKPKKTDSSSSSPDKSGISPNKKASPKSAGNKPKEENNEELSLAFLKQEAADKQNAVKELFDKIVKGIKNMSDEELPRRKKTSKVSVVVSDGKEPGDTITFENPHIPGQRLQVKVPKGLSAGAKFIVSVPAPAVSDETDANKWDREFQELVADFAATYDEWCQAEGKNCVCLWVGGGLDLANAFCRSGIPRSGT
jgi:hypothetical protein